MNALPAEVVNNEARREAAEAHRLASLASHHIEDCKGARGIELARVREDIDRMAKRLDDQEQRVRQIELADARREGIKTGMHVFFALVGGAIGRPIVDALGEILRGLLGHG